MGIAYARESVESVKNDIGAMAAAHYEEASGHRDAAFNINWDMYLRIEASGALRGFTVRDSGELIGYAAFVVAPSLHASGLMQANTIAIYLRPDRRGRGEMFIMWIDGELCREGVGIVYHSVKPHIDYSPALKRLGYGYHEAVYSKRLGGK